MNEKERKTSRKKKFQNGTNRKEKKNKLNR